MAVTGRRTRVAPRADPLTVYLVRTTRRAGLGEVQALARAFGRIGRRHPEAALREVFSDEGRFAAVVEARGSGRRSEECAARMFDEAWGSAFGPLSCPHHLEPVTDVQIEPIKGRQPEPPGR